MSHFTRDSDQKGETFSGQVCYFYGYGGLKVFYHIFVSWKMNGHKESELYGNENY